MLIETLQKEFLVEKKFEGLTQSSIDAYTQLFKTWNEWLDEQSLEHVEDLSGRTIKQFLMHCIECGNNAGTVNTKLRRLRVFAKWLFVEGITKDLLTEGIKEQRENKKPKLVSTDDVRIVLSHLRRTKRRENSFTARRNYVLVIFLIGTGLRIGELERLTWLDVNFAENLIRINESKSRRQQSVPLSETLARALRLETLS